MTVYNTITIDDTTTIDGLPPAAPLTGPEKIPISQGGITSRTSAASIAALGTVLTLQTSSVTNNGTISTGGLIWVNNTSGGPITLNLNPALSPFIMFADIAGNVNINPVTIASSSGILGGVTSTTTVLSIPYQWVWLAWNGISYSVIG